MTAETLDPSIKGVTDDKDLEQTILKSPSSIDQILSKKLFQLSIKDRNSIEEEAHGISTLAPEESPQFLESALFQLSEEIELIPDTSPSKTAYIESQVFPETYVNTPDFRLRFLRCELFDVKKAATRMLKFLDYASDLFGPVVLQRPMRMMDFTSKELKLMKVGNVQLLPYRDRSGRQIFTVVGGFGFIEGTMRMRHKMYLYMFYCMSEDIESQRKGMTKLIWGGSNNYDAVFPGWEFHYVRRMMESIPIRLGATHFCVPDKPYFHMLRAVYGLALGSNLSRIKFHVGDGVELLYKVKSFGIPVDLIPVTLTGKIKTANMKQWMRTRTRIEEAIENGDDDTSSSMIDNPRSTDVLFRGGTSLLVHPGNCVFHGILESKVKEHFLGSRLEKIAITKTIIQLIERKEGRFLQWDSRGWWIKLEDESHIHARVAEKMRTLTTKIVSHQQTSCSSTHAFENQDNSKRRKISHRDSNAMGCGGGCCF